MQMTFSVSSVEETGELAAKLAEIIEAGDIVLLTGDLGAGKTVFVQFLSKCLGVVDEVTSPSFSLVKEYRGTNLPIFHFDVYRLNKPQEFIELGSREYLFDDGLSIIEWGEKVIGLVGEDYLMVSILIEDGEARTFIFEDHGYIWENKLGRVR